MGITASLSLTGIMRKIQLAAMTLVVYCGCRTGRPVPVQTPLAPTRQQGQQTSYPDRGEAVPAGTVSANSGALTGEDREQAIAQAVKTFNEALEDAFFDFDRHTLRPDATEALTKDASFLRDAMQSDPSLVLIVEGHCDERGSAEYNLTLGDRRAQQAKEFLAQLGIPGDRVAVVSYGKEQPVCAEQDESCWQKNRRAHVRYERSAR